MVGKLSEFTSVEGRTVVRLQYFRNALSCKDGVEFGDDRCLRRRTDDLDFRKTAEIVHDDQK